MILFADYEGFAVAWSLIFWIILTAPALILGLVGVVAGALRRPGCAVVLGLTACSLELLGVAFVWLCFRGERARLGAYADHFRPGHPYWAAQLWPSYHFWEIAILTLFLGSLAIGLGAKRPRTPTVKKDGDRELGTSPGTLPHR
jgi:hypothetical protein